MKYAKNAHIYPLNVTQEALITPEMVDIINIVMKYAKNAHIYPLNVTQEPNYS